MRAVEETANGRPVQSNEQVLSKLDEIYREAFAHDGFAEIRIELRILRRGQKEVILHYGRQYRFMVDYPSPAAGRQGTGGEKSKHAPVGLVPVAEEETGWRRGVAAQPAGEEPDIS